MKRYIQAAKESNPGVFWVIDDELLAFPFDETFEAGLAKSGNTFNHAKLWPHVKPHRCNKPYNYYPRGRVEFTTSGKARIYLNPHVPESLIPQIKTEFGIRDEPQIVYDTSNHYHCYLDEEMD